MNKSPSFLRVLGGTCLVMLLVPKAFASGPNYNDTTSQPLTNSSAPNFSGNVGINSASPGHKLDVTGTVRTTGFWLNTSPAAGYVMVSTSAGVGTWMPSTTLNVSATATPGGSSPQLQYNNANSMGGIGSGGSDGTNIGVGTVSFKNRLDIVGNVGISTLANSPYVTNTLASPDALVVEGNVGIGTWKPIVALDIQGGNIGIGTITDNGAVTIDSGGTSIYLSNNSGGGGLTVWMDMVAAGTRLGKISRVGNDLAIDAWANGGEILLNSASGTRNVGIGTLSPVSKLAVAGNMGVGTTGGSPYITTSAPSGGVIVEGNVGIGSTRPGQKLDVQGTARIFGNVGIGTSFPTTPLDVHGGGTGYAIVFRVSTNLSGGSTMVLGDDIINGDQVRIGVEGWLRSQSSQFQLDTTGDPMTFAIANVEKMRISSDGNVGIGSAAPGKALDISGTVRIFGGNLGIGSSAPGQSIDVQGTVRTAGFILSGNGVASGNVLVSTSTGLGTWMPTSTLPQANVTSATVNQITFYSGVSTLNGSSNLVFNTPNVGVGTVTPLATIQVVGNIGIGTVKNGDNYIRTTPPNGGMIIETNVGIGTYVPGYPLDVRSNVGGYSIFSGGAIYSVGGFDGVHYLDANNENYYLDPDGTSLNGNYSMAVQKNVGIGSLSPS